MEAGTAGFKEARRELDSLLAPAERRALRWLAEHTPSWINSDHLTVLGLAAMLLGGVCYALSARDAAWLFGVNVALALNWLGDSLDGTLARVRNRQRPFFAPSVRIGGTPYLLFDIIGALATAGIFSVLLWSTGSTIRKLYEEERLPPA